MSYRCDNQDEQEQNRIRYLKDLASQIALELGLDQTGLENWMNASSTSKTLPWRRRTNTQIGTLPSETPVGKIGRV